MRKNRFLVLSLISTLLLLAALSTTIVTAQSTATVVVSSSADGTTDVTGTQTYPDGSSVTITATPNSGLAFQSWTISPSDNSGTLVIQDNPVTFNVKGGVTYTVTPSFVAPTPIPGQVMPTNLSTAAIVVIFPSAGGTTIPAPGTYALADATSFNLTAMPTSGWRFDHWTICGDNASHGTAPVNWDPTDNPYNVNHGYGAVYRYQAVFAPISSTSPSPSPTIAEIPVLAGIAFLLALIPVVVLAKRRK